MKAAPIGIAVVLVAYMGLSVYGARAAMEIPRLPLNDSPASVGLNYEDVAFTSRVDSVLLKGWFIPSENDSVIVIVHGGFQNRVDYNVDTLALARDLAHKGFGLLLFDLRGRGESEGKGLSLSNIERDIGGAVDYLKQRGYSAERIGIIGFCSGAASAVIFASQENIGALVLDGCVARVTSMFKAQGALRGIPGFLVDFFTPGVLLMAKLLYGYEMMHPVDVVASVACPTLFIYEERDNTIPVEDARRLFQASGGTENELWIVPDAEHSQAYRTFPSKYVEKVASFLARLGNRKPGVSGNS